MRARWGGEGVAARNSAWWEMHRPGCGTAVPWAGEDQSLGRLHWDGVWAWTQRCVCLSPFHLCPFCLQNQMLDQCCGGASSLPNATCCYGGRGTQKAAAFGEVERKSSILVLFFWPCPGGCFLAAPEVSSGFFSDSLRAWRRPRAVSSYRTLLVKVLLVCP